MPAAAPSANDWHDIDTLRVAFYQPAGFELLISPAQLAAADRAALSPRRAGGRIGRAAAADHVLEVAIPLRSLALETEDPVAVFRRAVCRGSSRSSAFPYEGSHRNDRSLARIRTHHVASVREEKADRRGSRQLKRMRMSNVEELFVGMNRVIGGRKRHFLRLSTALCLLSYSISEYENMPDLRKDPIVGRWVIVAKSRARRPHDFSSTPQLRSGTFCPFCEGNEDQTPGEIIAYRGHGTSPIGQAGGCAWCRTSFPALEIEGDLRKRGDGIYDMMRGVGATK